jgi:hypothetical protein
VIGDDRLSREHVPAEEGRTYGTAFGRTSRATNRGSKYAAVLPHLPPADRCASHNLWPQQGGPKLLALAEFGVGRGTSGVLLHNTACEGGRNAPRSIPPTQGALRGPRASHAVRFWRGRKNDSPRKPRRRPWRGVSVFGVEAPVRSGITHATAQRRGRGANFGDPAGPTSAPGRRQRAGN